MSDGIKPQNTNNLQSRLFKTLNIKTFLEKNNDTFETTQFCDYILKKCMDLGEVPERVIKRANIDRTYGHQLFQGIRAPSRDKVIQLAIGFGMDVEETQKLLKLSNKSELYVKIKRDAAILFCINRKLDIFETEELLQELGIQIFKRGNSNE